jgi:hypothetical protein
VLFRSGTTLEWNAIKRIVHKIKYIPLFYDVFESKVFKMFEYLLDDGCSYEYCNNMIKFLELILLSFIKLITDKSEFLIRDGM